MLAATAAIHGDRPALTMLMSGEDDEAPRSWTYRQMVAGVTRAANLFAELGGRGAGVAFLLPNLLETQLTLWGAETSGYAVPLNFLLGVDQIAGLVRASGAKLLVALGPHPQLDIWQKALRVREMLPGLVLVCVAPPGRTEGKRVVAYAEGLARQSDGALGFDDPPGGAAVSAYFHTGGTTGSPKLVAHTHTSQLAAALGGMLLMGLGPSDVFPHGLPLFHAAGAVAVSLSFFAAGGHMLMLSPAGLRSPVMLRRHWRIVEHHRATIIGGVPTSIGALCEVPVDGDLSSVRFAITGAAATPRAVAERFESLTGTRLHEILGMTETSGLLAIDSVHGERTPGSVGVRIPYLEMRIRRLDRTGSLTDDCASGEIGVLTVRGPNVSPGYRDPAQNAAWMGDGWLDTGDLAFTNDAGKLFIAGRSKDLIIRGGHNIDPAMIEDAFSHHPAVALAAAVGEPDAHAGELPICYIALRPGATATEPELRAFAEARIAERPAWPRQIHLLPELPLTAVGKIYKPALRSDAARRVVEGVVSQILGHAPAEITAVPGGRRGMNVTVRLSRDDASHRSAVEEALGAYLFETVVQVEGE